MRCLTLADALREEGAAVHFICRAHESHLIAFIRDRRYACSALESAGDAGDNPAATDRERLPGHASWLGTSWQRDAEETGEVLKRESCDWLIVDHYAIDWRWESELRSLTEKIMVIDDLANRKHDCDVLLDSVCGREPEQYRDLVPTACRLLLGSKFVLLRPEFAEWRSAALQRREKTTVIRRLLVTLGGMDSDNFTGAVLDQLAEAELSADMEVDVVLGAGFARVEKVKDQAGNMSVETNISSAVDNMAERMANADLAISGSGVSVWERCCLGLPGIILILSEEQRANAAALSKENIGRLIFAESFARDFRHEFQMVMADYEWYQGACFRSGRLVDGLGIKRATGIFAEQF